MSRRIPCGPTRAEKELYPRHVQIGTSPWTKAENGKWYNEAGEEVEVVEQSLGELLTMMLASSDR